MIYDLKNYQDLNSLYIHDYELKDISVDYNSKALRINLLNTNNQLTRFNIKFYSFYIECFEPWGEGIYIDSLSVSLHRLDSERECMNLDLLINSGDKLTILAKEIEF